MSRPDAARLVTQCGFMLPEAVRDAALDPLIIYLEMLCRWNAVMNLSGARRWREALCLLAADSFHLAAFLDTLPLPEQPECWDLGAGAGLPGVPLRLVWSRGQYHMVEVREKRALFLANVLDRLALPRTHVHRVTAEDFFIERARKADCIVSRAFMPWRELVALVRPQLAATGFLIIAAQAPAPEAGDIPQGWRLVATHAYTVANAGNSPASRKERWFWALSLSDKESA